LYDPDVASVNKRQTKGRTMSEGKLKKTWHVTLTDGTVLSYKTKKQAVVVCFAIHGVENLVWFSSVQEACK
jgi:hypothetical protein